MSITTNTAPSHGAISAANESSFNVANLSTPLTSYATGWRDPENLDAVLDALVGTPVITARKFEYREWPNSESFLTDGESDLRAIGAEFKQLKFTGETHQAKLDNRGLMIRLDRDEYPENDPMYEQRQVQKLLQQLRRNSLMRAVALLTAAAVNTGKTWDVTAGKDPDQDVEAELSLAADASGVYPNRVFYGHTAWLKRKLAHRAQNTAGGFASAQLKPEDLAAALSVDHVGVGKSRYQSSPTAKSQIMGNLVYMYIGNNGGSIEDPANIKRFTDGAAPRVFREERGPKWIEITVEHYEKILITSALGVRTLTIS